MGHEVPGMRGVYSHITPRMRAQLRDGLQELWEASLHERAHLADRSAVKVLDRLLAVAPGPAAIDASSVRDIRHAAPDRSALTKIGSHLAPKIGH
jgi:hypothetical protein